MGGGLLFCKKLLTISIVTFLISSMLNTIQNINTLKRCVEGNSIIVNISSNKAYAKAALNRCFFDILCNLIQKKEKGHTVSDNLERFHIKMVAIYYCCTVKLPRKVRLRQIDLLNEAGIITAKLTKYLLSGFG